MYKRSIYLHIFEKEDQEKEKWNSEGLFFWASFIKFLGTNIQTPELRWDQWSVRPCQGQEHGKTLRPLALRGWPRARFWGSHPSPRSAGRILHYLILHASDRGTQRDKRVPAWSHNQRPVHPEVVNVPGGYCREGQSPSAFVSWKFHLSTRHLFKKWREWWTAKRQASPYKWPLELTSSWIIIWWLAHSSLKPSPTETNFTRTETFPPAASFSWRDSQDHSESTHLSLRCPCRLTPEDYLRVVSLLTRKGLQGQAFRTPGSRVLGVKVRGWPGGEGLQMGLNLRCFCPRGSLRVQGAAIQVTPCSTECALLGKLCEHFIKIVINAIAFQVTESILFSSIYNKQIRICYTYIYIYIYIYSIK